MCKEALTVSLAALFLLSIMWGGQTVARDYFVAPGGNDANLGTPDRPLATLEAARGALRDSGQLGRQPCRVILQEGVYRLTNYMRDNICIC